MLDQNDVQALTRRFEPGEHEFKQKYVYVTEGAVATRIEEVDPSWTFEIIASYTRDNQAVVNARLTIKGVSRDGVGMQDIKETAGEPEKGAATDALKRAARLFGIGRYLLDVPGFVTNMQTLTEWLTGAKSNATSQNNGASTNKGNNPQNGANGAQNANSDDFDKPAVEKMIKHYEGKLTMDQLLEALHVARFSEWTQGKKAAFVAIENHLRLATMAAGTPQ